MISILVFLDFNTREIWRCQRTSLFQSLFSWISTIPSFVKSIKEFFISILVFLDFNGGKTVRIERPEEVFQSLFSWISTLHPQRSGVMCVRISILVFLDFNSWERNATMLWLLRFQSLFSWISTRKRSSAIERSDGFRFQSLFSWISTAYYEREEWARRIFQSLFSWISTICEVCFSRRISAISILVFLDFNQSSVIAKSSESSFQSLFSWISTNWGGNHWDS